MRMKQRMVKGTTAMALFAALVAYMVAHPRLVHATFPGLNGRISFARLSSARTAPRSSPCVPTAPENSSSRSKSQP